MGNTIRKLLLSASLLFIAFTLIWMGFNDRKKLKKGDADYSGSEENMAKARRAKAAKSEKKKEEDAEETENTQLKGTI